MPVTIGRTALEGCRILGITPEQAGIELHKPTLPPKRRDLADTFAVLWERFGPPGYPMVREFRFHPTRRWRFDAAWPERKVFVELNGGIWTGGRHTRGDGYRRDMEKLNAATMLGWVGLQFWTNDLELSPIQVIETVANLLEQKGKP